MIYTRLAVFLAAVLTASMVVPTRSAWAVPKVVVSIAPLHSIVAGVMEGLGTPDLIVNPTSSPHTYALRPSDARALNEAELILWVGPELETFLVKPLASLGGKAAVVAAHELPGVILLPPREGGAFEAHSHGGPGEHEHAHEEHGGEEYDAHLWLDPANAIVIARAMGERLAALDTPNAVLYRRNTDKLVGRLTAADKTLADALAPLKGRPFVVFHDAYQYFEHRYGVTAIGSITINPDSKPGPRRLQDIRNTIRHLNAVCVFREPQFEPSLVQTAIEGTNAKTGVLDPEGAAFPPGPDLYFQMLQANAEALKGCLAG